MAKPLDLTGGHGIEKLKTGDFASTDEMYDYLKEHNFGLCEQYIVQHHDMAAFNPYSVNTFRICTILTNGEPHVLYFYVRMGNGEKVVDNLHSGGLTCPVDWETGKIKYKGYALFDKYYDVHPNTGHPLVGEQLPFWKEAIEMCFEAAKSLPQVAYVGWDVGITENGPVLIEGNPFPGTTFCRCRRMRRTESVFCRISANISRIFKHFRRNDKNVIFLFGISVV